MIAAPHLFATDTNWTGASSVTWNTGTNWSTGTRPGNTDNGVFNGTFNNQPNLGGAATAGGLWMTGSIGQNVTISGTTLTLNGNTINSTAGLGILVDNSNAFALTISAPIKVGGAQTWRNNSANLLTIGAVNTNGFALTIDGSGNTSVTGVLSSTGAVTKSGSGTLTISNTGDTYSGQLTVQAGTLSIDTINNVSSNGELGNNALAVILGNTGSVTGTLEYTGATASSTKTFTMATGGTGAFQIDTAGTTLTLSGVIGGSGALLKTGAGTLTLSGANTYTGLTTVSAGTLTYGASNVISTGAVTVNGSTAVLDLAANHTDTVGTVTVDGGGSITGTGTSALTSTGTFEMKSGSASAILAGTGIALNKTTSGTVTLTGANTFTGVTTITAGTLSVSSLANGGSASNIGSSTNAAANLIFNGGTLQYTGATASTDRNFTINTGTTATFDITTNNLTISGASTATNGALTKTGAGTLTLSGANTYTGLTTVSAGTLAYGASNVISTGAVTVNGSTAVLDLAANHTDTVGTVTVDGGGSITGTGTSALTSTGTFEMKSGSASAILAGTGVALNKTTSGTVTLSGANTFTGATTISNGTLITGATSGSALGSTSGITVNSGGTLSLGSNDQINNSATMTLAGGTFAKGNFSEGTTSSVGVGALTLTANSHIDFGTGTVGVLTFASLNASTFTLTIDNWTGNYNTVGSASTDRLIFDSDQTSNLSSFYFTGYGAGGVQFALGGGFYEVVAAVPEPSTWIVGILGVGALGYYHVRRRWRVCSRRR